MKGNLKKNTQIDENKSAKRKKKMKNKQRGK